MDKQWLDRHGDDIDWRELNFIRRMSFFRSISPERRARIIKHAKE